MIAQDMMRATFLCMTGKKIECAQVHALTHQLFGGQVTSGNGGNDDGASALHKHVAVMHVHIHSIAIHGLALIQLAPSLLGAVRSEMGCCQQE